MNQQPKVKFLTAIWGTRYIEEFSRTALLSYLSPGNIPFIASQTKFEVIILTSADSVRVFDTMPAFRTLRSICPVRYILIDDLIAPGNYGVTLTLAYARGIMDSGAEQRSTYFVFMNSDFVLADGSLRTVLQKIEEGHPCIMAPSLRATAETTLPRLIERVDEHDHVLSIAPRDLVRLAFDHLHPTVMAKTVTQNLFTCGTHNQLYWQVDDSTLLARHYLIFMLAIKPEVQSPLVNSYCDYGFVPELVPSGRFEILDDSDNFFMLELQPLEQERNFVRVGPKSARQIATELSAWTTKEHRRFAAVDIAFHSRDLPAAFSDARRSASEFVAQITRAMKKPRSHAHHIYWVLGLQSWILSKFLQFTPALPPEAAPVKFRLPKRVFFNLSIPGLAGFAIRKNGRFPTVPIWHPRWKDAQLISSWMSEMAARPGNILFISDPTSLLLPVLKSAMKLDVCTELGQLRLDQSDQLELLGRSVFDRYARPNQVVLIDLPYSQIPNAAPIIEHIEAVLRPARIDVFVREPMSTSSSSDLVELLASNLENFVACRWMHWSVDVTYSGNRFGRRMERAEDHLRGWVMSGRVTRLLGAMLLWPVVVLAMGMNNRLTHAAMKQPRGRSTGVLLRMARRSPNAYPELKRRRPSGLGSSCGDELAEATICSPTPAVGRPRR